MSKLEKMKQFQTELDRRTQVEEQAWALIAECKFEEANKLLDSLNDEAFIEMLDWEEEEETCHITLFAILVVLILTQENIVIASKRTTKKMKNSILMMLQIMLFQNKKCTS